MAWKAASAEKFPQACTCTLSHFLARLCKPACLLGTYQDMWVTLQPSLESTARPVAEPQTSRCTSSAKVSTPALLNQQHMFFWLKGV